jgi:hypothetical protein
MSPPRFLRRAVLGARVSSPPEQAAFGGLTSFAATIGISRTLNYVRERRRRFPAAAQPHTARLKRNQLRR